MKNFYDLFKPKLIFTLSNNLWSFIIVSVFILIISSLYLITIVITADFQQGETYKIIYVHVPAAWICLTLYTIIAILSLIYLIYKHNFIYFMARITAIIGIHFTFITLVTGSLWGKPIWGTYWVWDARLTSVLILFFLYLGYLIIYHTYDIKSKAMYNSSLLAIVGFINIPIIKYSVEWWNTLHQPSSLTQNYVALDLSILILLLNIFIIFIILSFHIFILEIRKFIIYRKIKTFYI